MLILLTMIYPFSTHAAAYSGMCDSLFVSNSEGASHRPSHPDLVFPAANEHGAISQAEQNWAMGLARKFFDFTAGFGIRSHAKRILFWNNFYSNVIPGTDSKIDYKVSLSTEAFANRDETVAAHELSHIATADLMGLNFVPSNMVWVVTESFSDVMMLLFTGKAKIGLSPGHPPMRSFDLNHSIDAFDKNLTARNIGKRGYRNHAEPPQTDGHLASLLVTRFLFQFYQRSSVTFAGQFKQLLSRFGAFYRPLLQSDFSYVKDLYQGNIHKSGPAQVKIAVTISDLFFEDTTKISQLVGQQENLQKLILAVDKVKKIYPIDKEAINPYAPTAILELHLVAAIFLELAPRNQVAEALVPLEGDLALATDLNALLFH